MAINPVRGQGVGEYDGHGTLVFSLPPIPAIAGNTEGGCLPHTIPHGSRGNIIKMSRNSTPDLPPGERPGYANGRSVCGSPKTNTLLQSKIADLASRSRDGTHTRLRAVTAGQFRVPSKRTNTSPASPEVVDHVQNITVGEIDQRHIAVQPDPGATVGGARQFVTPIIAHAVPPEPLRQDFARPPIVDTVLVRSRNVTTLGDEQEPDPRAGEQAKGAIVAPPIARPTLRRVVVPTRVSLTPLLALLIAVGSANGAIPVTQRRY